MTISHRVAKNTAFLTVDNAVSRVLGFVVKILLFRLLTLNEYGLFTYAFSFTQLFFVVADMGLEYYTIREVARDREGARAYVGKILPLKLLLFVVAVAVTVAAAFAVKDGSARALITIFALYTFGRTFFTFFEGIIKGFEKMGPAAAFSILESLLVVLFVVALIRRGDSAVKVGVWYCITLAAAMVPAAVYAVSLTGLPRLRFDTGFWKRTLVTSWPFAASIVAVLVHSNVDIVMVKFFKGPDQVALYNPGILILTSIGIIQSSLSVAIYPVISRMHGNEPEALGVTYEKTFKLLTLAGLPFYTGAAILAKPLLLLLFGPKAAAGADAMTILCAAYFFINYASFYATFAAGIDKQKYYVQLNIVSVIVNILINLVFIPKWGIRGASAATVLSTAFLTLWIHFTVMRPYRKFNVGAFLAKVVAILVFMSAAAYWLRGVNLFLAVGAGGAVYAAGILLLKPYSKDDLLLIKKAFRNR